MFLIIDKAFILCCNICTENNLNIQIFKCQYIHIKKYLLSANINIKQIIYKKLIFKTNYFKNKVIMKTIKNIKGFLPLIWLIIIAIIIIKPLLVNASNTSTKVIYPLKKISKLDCRFTEFSKLSSDCKQDLPILHTKDYSRYATMNWWYNKYTRIYTMLWWASYKYGWDIWHWGHIWTDIATSKWTPVYSIADWKVIKAKKDIMEWNMISIQHNINGKYIVSNYLHLSKMNVKKWDIIKVWTKIWEVWSTWNSTWNHLHFQIDLDTPFHPYYYNYNKCPFSYYKITEEWLCIDELAKNTIDPLLFLETKWAIVDKIQTSKYRVDQIQNSTTEDLSIFNRTVYIGYNINDIKKVQEIFKKIWVYKWSINWKYEDIESSIISYQLTKKLISNKNTYWAGRFGPKTRYQAKKDYLSILSWSKTTKIDTNNTNNIKLTKISRKHLLSREEIEKIEVDTFLKKYKVELNFVNKTSNIKKNTTEILKLNIKDKRGNAFKWEMPWWMTFVVNTEKVNVFPKKLFYFKDWKRDIYIKGLNEWTTNLYIKIWNIKIKTIPLKIYNWDKTIYPKKAKILSSWWITLWDNKTWIVLFKGNDWKNLINIPFWSIYNIKASNWNKICIKKGKLKDIKKIYRSKCNENEYKNEYNFTYKDTVGWLLIYNFKANSKNFKIIIKNNYNNKNLSEKNIAVSNPKWLTNNYVYSNEIISMLEKWIVDWINKWYFQENKNLTQRDAFVWIKNTLESLKNQWYDNKTDTIIENNIVEINKMIPYSNISKTISRKEFLDLTTQYLVFNRNNYSDISFRDLDEEWNRKISQIFDSNNTWRDKFGENYFRPEEKITRWESAYLLSQSLDKIHQSYLTLK